MAGPAKNGNRGSLPWWVWLVGFIVLTGTGVGVGVLPFIVFWIIYRLVKANAGPSPKAMASDAKQDTRIEKYLIMTEGRSAESIEYLASAVGVSYDTVLRDLQKMVSEGRFGPAAYINYVDRTVVLKPSAQKAAAPKTPAAAPAKDRPSGGTQGSNMISRAAASDARKKADLPRTTVEADKSDDKVRTALLIAGIVLIGIGVLRLALGGDTVFGIISGVLTALGGVGLFGYRGFLKKRENRFKLYEAACEGRDFVPIAELSKKAGISPKKCRRDLEAMLEKGYLPKSAYIDNGEGALILKPGAAPKAETDPAPPDDGEDRYKAILRRIRKLNDDIPDETMSRRIDEIEDLTGRIFKAVQEKPEKEPQIKSFMSYYLPTTLKLLQSYADFERSGVRGENVESAKAEIERILDTLVDGFRKQLDKLFETEAMDISSDIDVLETMLRRDGLSSDGSAFQVKKKP